jgi:hypothetical protein
LNASASTSAIRAEIGLAGSALLLTTAVAVGAKIAGVVIGPGARGVLGERAVVLVETAAGALAYTLTALLVALVCAASFELARNRTLHSFVRGGVVAMSGLIVALASPAVVQRLDPGPSLALSLVTSSVVLIAGGAVVRTRKTRAVGGVLLLLSTGALFRVIAYEAAAFAFERASMGLLTAGRVISTLSILVQSLAVLVGAAWIGTRARWKGRILANSAILVAFAITWLAARGADDPSAIESILRFSLPAAAAITPQPYMLASIAAFMVPASVLLAGVVLVLTEESPLLLAPIALALVTNGIFDVPLHALLALAGSQWALLSVAEDQRSGV